MAESSASEETPEKRTPGVGLELPASLIDALITFGAQTQPGQERLRGFLQDAHGLEMEGWSYSLKSNGATIVGAQKLPKA